MPKDIDGDGSTVLSPFTSPTKRLSKGPGPRDSRKTSIFRSFFFDDQDATVVKNGSSVFKNVAVPVGCCGDSYGDLTYDHLKALVGGTDKTNFEISEEFYVQRADDTAENGQRQLYAFVTPSQVAEKHLEATGDRSLWVLQKAILVMQLFAQRIRPWTAQEGQAVDVIMELFKVVQERSTFFSRKY